VAGEGAVGGAHLELEEVVVVARRGMRYSGVSLSKADPRSTPSCQLVDHAWVRGLCCQL
jgi:hypothetical protein